MSTNLKLLNAIIKLKKEIEAIKKDRPRDGVDGINGLDGRPGIDGIDGKPGKDGVGIKDAYINEQGHLILVLTNDKEIDCGKCQGENTVKTIRSMGRTSNSIKDAKIVNGELLITLENGKVINAGSVVAEPGEIIEKDPIFSNSPAGSITTENIESWNNKVEDNEYVHTDNNFTNEYIDKINNNEENIEKITPKEYFIKINTDIILEETNMTYAEVTKDIEENRPFVCYLEQGVQTFDMQLVRTSEYDGVGYYEFMGIVRNGINQLIFWFYIREDETTQIELVKVNPTKTSELENDSKFINEDYYIANAGDMKNYWANIQGMEIPNIVEGLNYLTTWILAHYTQKPDIIYSDPTGFEASNDHAGDTWHLTGLDLKPYKRIKCYVCSGGDSNSNYSPEHIVEVHLDDRAKGSFGYFSADHAGHCPNNRNRHHIATFTVNAEKTAIQFQHSISIYGTSASDSVGGRRCYLIEGYYD